MRHSNSVFHDLLKRIPWSVFERLVAEHEADKGVRRLSTKSQFVALLYGQLAGAVSLREIEGGLTSHAGRLYHLGARPPSRSTLCDANARRPSAVFAGLFAALLDRAGRGLRRTMGEAIHLIDATRLPLAGPGSEWASASPNACAAKLHLVFEPDRALPVAAGLTSARVNDITFAKTLAPEPGATYVFDLGYYDFAWWASLEAAGCRIVTRFKSHTRLDGTKERPLGHGSAPMGPGAEAGGGLVLSDRVGHLPRRMARRRTNPFAKPLREIRVRIASGKVLRLLTNDLDAPAGEIARLYRQRWGIELFFRWIKQTLKIRHFLGRSENAVRIQIAVALIAYLLLRLARADQTAVHSPLAFARLVRANLMHRKRTDALARPPKPPPPNPNQIAFQWT